MSETAESRPQDAGSPEHTLRTIDELLILAANSLEENPLDALGFAAVAYMRAVQDSPDVAIPNAQAAHAAHIGFTAVQRAGTEPDYVQTMWQKRVGVYNVPMREIPPHADLSTTRKMLLESGKRLRSMPGTDTTKELATGVIGRLKTMLGTITDRSDS